MLHLKGPDVDHPKVVRLLHLLQSTSPSYILMASLDLARMQMATEGEKLLGKALSLARWARGRIKEIPGPHRLGKKGVMERGMGDLDETKLTINVSGLGISGYEVSQILNTEHDIQVEMSDPFHVLVIVSIGDRREDLILLVKALEQVAAGRRVIRNPGLGET